MFEEPRKDASAVVVAEGTPAKADVATASRHQEMAATMRGQQREDKAFTAIPREGFGALQVMYQPVTWINRRQILDP